MPEKLLYDADFDTITGPKADARQVPGELDAIAAINAGASAALATATTASKRPVVPDLPEGIVRLHQGVKTTDGFLRDAAVRELTGEDEEELAKAGTSFLRFFSVLLERGTKDIGGIKADKAMLDKLLIGDREELMLGIRAATFGDQIKFEGFECPHCEGKSDLSVNISAIPRHKLADPDKTEYEVPLRKGTAVVRLATGADQIAAYGRAEVKQAEANSILLTRCVLSINGLDPSPEKVRAMGIADRRTVLTFLDETQPGPRYTEIAYTHDGCGEVVQLAVGIAELFRGL